MTAPVNLKEQLRAEALSRAGVFTSRADRAKFDGAFDALWSEMQCETNTLREERDNALESLRLCREELRLARLEYGALKEAALDCADRLAKGLAQIGGRA